MTQTAFGLALVAFALVCVLPEIVAAVAAGRR